MGFELLLMVPRGFEALFAVLMCSVAIHMGSEWFLNVHEGSEVFSEVVGCSEA